MEWWQTGTKIYRSLDGGDGRIQEPEPPVPRRKLQVIPPPLSPKFPQPRIMAADPFTSAAYRDRTSLTCSPLSFKDISEGVLPPPVSMSLSGFHGRFPETSLVHDESETLLRPIIEMVVCSFALHLVESPSELFSLLWELSLKSHWLVVLAPHKKPEIKEGWGWSKWNINSWEVCKMGDTAGELLIDRVHCRIYKSLNV